MRSSWSIVPALLFVFVCGCEPPTDGGWTVDSPATAAGSSDGGAVVPPGDGTLRVDLLWVVDNSVTMCQEQVALAGAIGDFVAALEQGGPVDLRTAVTSIRLGPDAGGGFNRTPASEFPLFCLAGQVFAALDDRHCECGACVAWDVASRDFAACLQNDSSCVDDPTAVSWVLERSIGPSDMVNENGSVNTTCRRRCGGSEVSEADADAECRATFGAPTMVCQVPGGDFESAGCQTPPATDACPDDLPAVLPAYDAAGTRTHGLDLFSCIATVGAEQRMRAGPEQGLAAAWAALDPAGPNPLQVCDPNDQAVLGDPALTDQQKRERCRRVFLRPGARLAVVFLSDEDDCSIEEGKNIAREDEVQCAMLGDGEMNAEDVLARPMASSTSDRPLAPVRKYVERYRSLRDNPDDVFVGAVVGDALVPLKPEQDTDGDGALTGQEVLAARDEYYASKLDRGRMSLNTYICANTLGRADLGRRYIDLVERFGVRGFRANLCSADGLVANLTATAAAVRGAFGGAQ